jgi:hypothetical protein
MNFQKKVIIFFVVLLLIIMIFLGVTMSNNKATNIPWPPIISNCPDYWIDTPDEPIPEFITVCSTIQNDNGSTEDCTLIPNPNNTNYTTYIKEYDQSSMTYNSTPISGTYSGQSTTDYMCVDPSGNIKPDCKYTNENNEIKSLNPSSLNLTCIGTDTDKKCGSLVSNPNYNNIPIPHVPGSRCIGTFGQNTGNYPYDPKNSDCIWDGKNYTSNCKNKKTSTVDFTSTGLNYIGANGNCNKQKWAIGNGNISWDGITYGFGEQNPCWSP